jgi:hypothetical protein
LLLTSTPFAEGESQITREAAPLRKPGAEAGGKPLAVDAASPERSNCV